MKITFFRRYKSRAQFSVSYLLCINNMVIAIIHNKLIRHFRLHILFSVEEAMYLRISRLKISLWQRFFEYLYSSYIHIDFCFRFRIT